MTCTLIHYTMNEEGYSDVDNGQQWDEIQKLNSDYKPRGNNSGGNGCMIALLCVASIGLSTIYGLVQLMS